MTPPDKVTACRDGGHPPPPVVQAARSPTVAVAAYRYAALGFSVLPLSGKVPAVSWEIYQDTPATEAEIQAWEQAGLLAGNVGLVCGYVSGGLVILDLDGTEAYEAFQATFPYLLDTYTVASGSGRGVHLYYRAEVVPPPALALRTTCGNLELRSNRLQVVAPPSTHPDTGQPYRVQRPLDLKRTKTLGEVAGWIYSLKPEDRSGAGMNNLPDETGKAIQSDRAPSINPRLIAAIAAAFNARGYKLRKGTWLNGPCIYPHNHSHNDRKPSFGYNVHTGYAHCFLCGSILAKDVAHALGIDPDEHGGLVIKGK